MTTQVIEETDTVDLSANLSPEEATAEWNAASEQLEEKLYGKPDTEISEDTTDEPSEELLDASEEDGKSEDTRTDEDYKTRWKDTKQAYDSQKEEIKALKESLEKQNSEADSSHKPVTSEEDNSQVFQELSSDEQLAVDDLLEESPELANAIRHSMQKEVNSLVASEVKKALDLQAKVIQDKQEEVVKEGAKTQLNADVEAKMPGAMELYNSPEFIDWETQNKNRLRSLVGHIDQTDTIFYTEIVSIYKEEKGLVAEKKAKSRDLTAETRSQAANVNGRNASPDQRKLDSANSQSEWDIAAENIEKDLIKNPRNLI